MGSGAEVPIVVAVDPDRFDEAARALSDAGVHVQEEMRAVGAIAGTVQQDLVGELDALEGVLAVERERSVQIPPPDSALQ